MSPKETRSSIQTKMVKLLIIVLILACSNPNQIAKKSNNNNKLDVLNSSPKLAEVGESLNVTLHQSYVNSTTIEFANLSDSNEFTLPCPTESTFNSSYTELQIEDIEAPNRSWLVEGDYNMTVINITSSNFYYSSFHPKGVGYLENISVFVRETDVAQTTGLTIYLYNAENDTGRTRPYQQVGILPIVDNSEIIGDKFYWHNITNIHARYNCSETFDDTFFLFLDKEMGGLSTQIEFNGTLDNELGDNSDDTIVLDSSENPVRFGGIVRVDIALKLDFSPLDNTPSPSNISLKINNTSVSDNGLTNSGSWINTKEYTNPSGSLEFDLSADWWDVTCHITRTQINYTKTDLKANTNYEIPELDLILWNASIDESIDSFDSRINNYSNIQFTIPANWSDIKAFNGSIENSIVVSGTVINGYRVALILGAGNGANWYITASVDNRTPGNGKSTIPFGDFYLLFTTLVIISLIYFMKRRLNGVLHDSTEKKKSKKIIITLF